MGGVAPLLMKAMPATTYNQAEWIADQRKQGAQDAQAVHSGPVARGGGCIQIEAEAELEQYEDAADMSGEELTALDEEGCYLFEQEFPQAQHAEQLNCERDHRVWTDLNLQLNHLRCGHGKAVQDLLKAVYRKVTGVRKDGEPGYWNNQAAWDHYDKRACLIGHSTYYHRASICLCGYPRRDGKNSGCGDVSFCPRCNYNLRRGPMLAEFGDSFAAALEVLFVTLSLSRDPAEASRLVYKDLTKSDWAQIAKHGLTQPYRKRDLLPFQEPEECSQCQVYWRLFNKAMKQAQKQRRISGAFGSLELAVRFRPLGVIPHAHYAAFSSGFSSDYARELRRTLKRLIRQTRRLTTKLHPSVAIYRICTPEDYRRVIKYVYKPVKVEQAYDFAAELVDHENDQMELLNREVNYFVEGLDGVFMGIQRTLRCGICSPRAHGYCGIVTPERQEEREAAAAYRKRKKAQIAKLEADLPGYRHRKPRLSQEANLARLEFRLRVKKAIRDGELPDKRPRPWHKRETLAGTTGRNRKGPNGAVGRAPP